MTPTAQYFQNPDFEEIFVFHGLEVPTSKKEVKPFDAEIQLKISNAFPSARFVSVKK